MKRSHQRWQAFFKAGLSRLGTQIGRALNTDEDVTVHTGPAERAGARQFAHAAAEMRGAMAKLAQLEAYFEGPGATVDGEARELLGQLWDHATSDDPQAIRRVVAEDLGAPVEELFARWDDQPIAAASIGQVHAAESRDGARLAVKVQYPGIAEALGDDLGSVRLLRRLAGAAVGSSLSDETLLFLRDRILGELDYVAEARQLEHFGRTYAGDPRIVVPRVYPQLSSARVLTMERLEGRTLPAFAESAPAGARNACARTLFRFTFGGPILHGLLHADPHPGNYLVLDDAGRVGFLDFGCTLTLPEALADEEYRFWLAIIHRDGETMRHALHREGLVAEARVFDGAIYRQWERLLAGPFLERREVELKAEDVRELGRLTAMLVRGRELELPPLALLLWRQRIGALSVMARLRPRLHFRHLLADLLDDGHHPQPLRERYP